MIHFDLSRTKNANQRSGLIRVSSRLAQGFGEAARQVCLLQPGIGPAEAAVQFKPDKDDWWLTAELFCEAECPGMWKFIRERRCRLAAIFHDAIPLKQPHITWPQSVARHPEYMKMLAEFDRVFAVSEASRRELIEFWQWQGVEPRAVVETIALGADFSGEARVGRVAEMRRASLLCVGILEPRKNQAFLLDVCERLWRENLAFDLHLVGRVNPHFGKPVLAKIKALQKQWRCLHYHEAVDDATMVRLYGEVRASVFPTIAEGCGLPLLESLWQGVPCVCSDLPVLRENADGGGCIAVAVNDRDRWCEALRKILTDAIFYAELARQTTSRPLPIWADSVKLLVNRLT
jgi:glycosyltransferase involved in cell wall biosynthesis